MDTSLDRGTGLVVVEKPLPSVFLIIAGITAVIIVLLFIIYFLRRNNTSGNGTVTAGTGSTQCVNNTDCTGTQVCNQGNFKCVDCTLDSDCPISKPFCDGPTNKCVSCNDNNQCPMSRPLCTNNRCIQCSSDLNCGGVTTKCDLLTTTCVQCTVSGDCPVLSPICVTASRTCAECASASDCIAPSTCTNGFCCNTAPPQITSSTGNPRNFTTRSSFIGTYTISQPPSSSEIVRIADPIDDFQFEIVTNTIADGTFNVQASKDEPNIGRTNIIYYAGFNYNISIAISQPCGTTAFSTPVTTLMPFPNSTSQPVIGSITSANTSTIRFTTARPDAMEFLITGGYCYFFQINGQARNPNRAIALSAADIDGQATGTDMKWKTNWPFAVSVGESFYMRYGYNDSTGAWVSPAVLVTVS